MLIWYPILPAGRHEDLAAPLSRAGIAGFHLSEVGFVDPPARGLTGSGLIGLNLPHGAAAAMAAAMAPFGALFRAR